MCRKTTRTHTLCAHRSTEFTHCNASVANPPRKCNIEVRQVFEHSLCERCRDPTLTANLSTTRSFAPLDLQTQRSGFEILPPRHAIPQDQVMHSIDANPDMTNAMQPPGISKKGKRHVFDLFRRKRRQVHIVANAFKGSSDESSIRISGGSKSTSSSARVSERSGDTPLSLDRGSFTKNEFVAITYPENGVEDLIRRSEGRRSHHRVESTKSEGISAEIPRSQVDIGVGDAVKVFDYNDTWNTSPADEDSVSNGSAIDITLNPDRLGSFDLAYGYQELIGQHPFEIELLEKAAALKEKEDIAKVEQQAAEATARDEAILENKRRQWQARKEAVKRARDVRKEREVAEAIAAQMEIDERFAGARKAEAQKAERYKDRARQREEERKKRESDVSALTTWTGLMKGVSGLPQQSEHMRIANEKINMRKTNAEMLSSPPDRGLALNHSRRTQIFEGVSLRNILSQSPQPIQKPSGLGITVPPPPPTRKVVEAEHVCIPKEMIKQNSQAAFRLTQEDQLQKRQAANPSSRPRMSHEESSSQTRLSGQKLKSKAKTWTGNLMDFKGSEKPKVLPLTYMRGGRWIGEDGAPIIREHAISTEMVGPFDKSTKLHREKLSRCNYEQRSPMEHLPSTFAPTHSSIEVQPLFAGKLRPSDGSDPSFASRRSGEESTQPHSHINLTPLLKGLELQNVVSETQLGNSPNSEAFQIDIAPPMPERNVSRRRQPTPSLIAADLRVGRSVDARHAWKNPRKDMGSPAEE